LGYITADADRDFSDYMTPNCDANDSSKKPCVDNRDQQWLTLGARADVYRGITVDLGVDIRIRSPGFPYGPPLAPWNLNFGLSYPLDVDSLTRPVVVTRTVEKDGPWKTEGQVTGVVRNARDGAPIPGALVEVLRHARSRAATDPNGGFSTPNVPAGTIDLEVTATNFEPVKVAVNVVAGKSVEVPVGLQPNPPEARVHGRVTDAHGGGVQASVKFTGVEIRDTKSDATGTYALSLPQGPYQVSTEAPGQPSKTSQVDLLVGEDKRLDLVLRAVTPNPKVVLNGDHITMKVPIRFVGPSAKATADAEKLMDAVADVLDAHGEVKRVRIVAHWDGSLPKPAAVDLTQAQADAVRAYLIGRGISAERLTAIGAGSDKPLVPNLTPANRARNRRVEFQLE
jgi:outer membrane protein OmpA-like peptidoglycan-associated protein